MFFSFRSHATATGVRRQNFFHFFSRLLSTCLFSVLCIIDRLVGSRRSGPENAQVIPWTISSFFSYIRLRAKDAAEGENRPRKAVEVVHRWLKKTRLYIREGEQKIRKTKLRKKKKTYSHHQRRNRPEEKKRSKANGGLLCIQLICTLLLASLFFPSPLRAQGRRARPYQTQVRRLVVTSARKGQI